MPVTTSVLIPTYTPTRAEGRDVSLDRVYLGGINVFLQEHLPFFRKAPRVVRRMLDAAPLLRLATRRGVSVDPHQLGGLTVSMLRGADGAQQRSVMELIRFLADDLAPEIVSLPNSLLIALAPAIKRELSVPVVCTLQGEDHFLDSLGEPFRAEALQLIREHAAAVDAFVAVSEYGAVRMSEHLGIDRGRIHVVPQTIDFAGHVRAGLDNQPFTIGYLARIAPEKGLHVLCEAYRRLRAIPGLPPSRLHVAGYLAPEHKGYLEEIRKQMVAWGLEGHLEYRGALDREAKLAFLQSLSVLSVPSPKTTQKAQFLLEAMASGVPVVQPRFGVFTEVVENTGGGDPHRPRGHRLPRARHRRAVGERRAEEATRSGGVRRSSRALRHGTDAGEAPRRVPVGIDGSHRRPLVDGNHGDDGKLSPTRRRQETRARGQQDFEGLSGPARIDPGAIGGRSHGGRRRLRVDRGAVRQWEEHAAAHRGGAGAADVRTRRAERRRTRSPSTIGAWPRSAIVTSASCSRTITCCRSARCSKTCSSPRWWLSPAHDGIERRARALIDEVGLADRIDHRPHELSGGEKQRVALARALVLQPTLVLCDEPTGSLDHAAAEVVTALLLDLHKRHRAILIVVTHNLDLAGRMGTRYRLSDARLNAR